VAVSFIDGGNWKFPEKTADISLKLLLSHNVASRVGFTTTYAISAYYH
jgi:hypothetical protein